MDDKLNITTEDVTNAFIGTSKEVVQSFLDTEVSSAVDSELLEKCREGLFAAIQRHTKVLSHIVVRSGLDRLYIAEANSNSSEVEEDG